MRRRRWRWIAACGLVAGLAACGILADDPQEGEVAPFILMTGGKEVSSGGSFFIPLDNPSNTVALFSESRPSFTLTNRQSTAIVIQSVTIEVGAGVKTEELTLQDTALKPGSLKVKDVTLQQGGKLEFVVRFYPVRGGERSGTVTIRYNSDRVFSFAVKGKGQTDLQFMEQGKGEAAVSRLFGGTTTDEHVSGMVCDKVGNCYFTGMVTQVVDKFAYDLFLGMVKADGSLGWAKIWSGPYRDYSPDPGQNDEVGGSAGSVALSAEGGKNYLYLAGSYSPYSSNNNYSALVIKVDAQDGRIIWERHYRPDWPTNNQFLTKHNATAYALAVRDYVYVTGSTGANKDQSDALVFFLGLDRSTGEVRFQKAVDVYKGYNDRGYVVRADGTGNAYIGGVANNRGMLLKFKSAQTTSPQLDWARSINLGLGSPVNDLDIDSTGKVYISCNRRGGSTAFSVLKMDQTGKVLWGKTYEHGSSSSRNDTHVVKVVSDGVLVGGRIGLKDGDTQMGDGLVVKLAGDGSLAWSSFYYTGRGPNEIAQHSVKGMALTADALYVGGMLYTGNNNGYRYWGYWYKGNGTLSAYSPSVSSVTPAEVINMTSSTKNASGLRQYMSAPTSLQWREASKKSDGQPPDADLFFMKINLK